MERIISGIYSTPNNFGPFTDVINEYINRLYASSIDFYEQKYVTNPTGTFDIDISIIEDSLGYIDDYLFYYYQFHYEDFPDIVMTLIQKLQYVTVLPRENRGIYGQFDQDHKIVYINPQLYASTKLSSDDRTRLYICHELGHIQNSNWMNQVSSLLEGQNLSEEDKDLIEQGFRLLDEATTQDRAENITYYFIHKNRPLMNSKRSRLFDGKPFETNFDYYGEFQEPTISFAKTLRGIGKLYNDEAVMEEFDRRTLKGDFATRVFNEYTMDGQLDNLFYMMIRLGKIKRASYALFGYDKQKYIYESAQNLSEYNERVKKMRDYRDPRNIE